jgi:hypothetical protein
LVAGYEYNRTYSEDQGESDYGMWLIGYAEDLINGVAVGLNTIVGQDADREAISYPTFWPTDVATDLADPSLDGDPTDPLGAPRMFTMGQVF